MGVASKIGEIAKSKGVALKELSRRVDIPYTTLYNAVNRDSKMEFETVKKIAVALGVSWYEFYPGDETNSGVEGWTPQKTESYKQQLDSAGAYLTELLTTAEWESGTDWTAEERNSWIKQKIPDAAKRFNVDATELNNRVQWDFPEGEEWLSSIQEGISKFNYRNNGQIVFKYVEKICRALTQLSEEGQREAAKRVQELAQIPAYQRPAEDGQTAPSASDDKEPAEK